MTYLAVGRVLRPHGIQGELLLATLTDFPEHLRKVDIVYVGDDYTPHPLSKARVHQNTLIVQLADCRDRDSAEALRNQLVYVHADAAAPLPPGRYYHHQIIGLNVVSDAGEALGTITHILETGANDVYVVKHATGELLLPAIKSVILSVDLEHQLMTVHLLDGLR